MSETAPAAAPGGHEDHGGHHTNYVKIWGILVVLLVLSVAGPFLGNLYVTLITAFGIALVKAYIVVRYFMHINVERRFVPMLLGTMLCLMALMVGAVSPDVLKHEGKHWENRAAKEAVKRGLAEGGGHHDAHPAGGEHQGSTTPAATPQGEEHH